MKFTLSRSQLILSCLGIVLIFVFLSRARHLFSGKHTRGVVVGSASAGWRTRASNPVISFECSAGSFTFQGESNLKYAPGDVVPVIYLEEEDPEPYIYTFLGFWLRPLFYALFPVVLALAALLSFFSAKDQFSFRLYKPFGLKVIGDAREARREQEEEEKKNEIRRQSMARLKTGKRK